MPMDIGLAAECVLSGRLDTNIASRWSVSLADEVGWASYDCSPPSDDDPYCDLVPILNRSRTISAVPSGSDSEFNPFTPRL